MEFAKRRIQKTRKKQHLIQRLNSGGGVEDKLDYLGKAEPKFVLGPVTAADRDQLYKNSSSRKINSIQENRTSRRPLLLLTICFPGRPIFIQLPPVAVEVIMALASGTILYVVFFEILPKAKEIGATGFQQVLAMVVGFGVFLPTLLLRKFLLVLQKH